jgi:hypothetical protein
MENSNHLETHKKFAVDLFNLTWELIEKEDRSQAEIDRMINAVHGSRYHWEIAGDAVHIARGEWLISRVYAILQRPEPCHYHASRCLQVTLENELKDFDLAFAYEAMARANDLTSNPVKKAKYLTLAKDSGVKIQDEDDREYFFSELQTIQPNPN